MLVVIDILMLCMTHTRVCRYLQFIDNFNNDSGRSGWWSCRSLRSRTRIRNYWWSMVLYKNSLLLLLGETCASSSTQPSGTVVTKFGCGVHGSTFGGRSEYLYMCLYCVSVWILYIWTIYSAAFVTRIWIFKPNVCYKHMWILQQSWRIGFDKSTID